MLKKDGFAKDTEVADHLNCSRSHVWSMVKKNPAFPRPIKISPGMTRFRWSDIHDIGETKTDK